MRLYNSTTSGSSTIPCVQHFNDEAFSETTTKTLPQKQRWKHTLRPQGEHQDINPPVSSSFGTSKPTLVRKLQTVWPPPQTVDSPDNGEQLSPIPATSTLSTLISPSSEEDDQEEPLHEKAGKTANNEASGSVHLETRETNEEQKQTTNATKWTPPKQLRRFTSSFQSPLRLSNIQVQSSPKFLRRFKESLRGTVRPFPPTDLPKTNEPMESPSEPLEFNIHIIDDDGDGQDAKDIPVVRTTGHSQQPSDRAFQSPLRASIKNIGEESPQLSKNETHTTGTSCTFDVLPGQVSSESFHFDIQLVKSSDQQKGYDVEDAIKEKKPQDEQLQSKADARSFTSKSSSSTLTSHCFDQQQRFYVPLTDEQSSAGSLHNASDQVAQTKRLHRPIAPASWSAMDGFVMRSDDGFVEGPLVFENDSPGGQDIHSLPDPIDVRRRPLVEEGQPHSADANGLFDPSVWDKSLSDGDSWTDFTADPFKYMQDQEDHVVAAPSKTAVIPWCLSKREQEGQDSVAASSLQKLTTLDAAKFPVQNKIASSLAEDKLRPLQKATEVARAVGKPKHRRAESRTRLVPLLMGPPKPEYKQKRHYQDNVKAKALARTENETSDDLLQLSNLPEKYSKMLKMGLPEGAVKNAMIRDGIDPSSFQCNIIHQQTASPPTTVPGLVDHYRRFRVHWEAHENIRSNTIWAMIERDAPWVKQTVQIDDAEYTKLFQETKDPVFKRLVRKDTGPAISGTVIDAKRANNGGIILARIKLSYREIAKAIDCFEYNLFTNDQVQGLLPFLPTLEEEEKLRSHISKVGGKHMLKSECEKFMAAMLFVRNAKEKLEAMVFMKQFNSAIEGIKTDSRLVQKASEELLSSSRLRKMFSVILELGNRLNSAGQSNKKRAAAIRIDSLSRLSQGKAFDRKTTFLQFVVSTLRRNSNDTLLLLDDLRTLRLAERVDVEQMQEDVKDLDARIVHVRRLALSASGEDDKSSHSEVKALSSTSVGRFALDACMKMASVHEEMKAVKQAFKDVLTYFGEEPSDEGVAPPPVFSIISQFCSDLDTALEQIIGDERVTRKVKNNLLSTRLQNSRHNGKGKPRSSLGSVIDAIRCKAFDV